MKGDTDISCDIPPDKADTNEKKSVTDIEEYSPTSPDNSRKTSEVSLLAEGIKGITITTRSSIVKAPNRNKCNYVFCDVVEGEVKVCGESSAAVQFKCSKLPAYQLHRFISAKNYRKYVCENCCRTILLINLDLPKQ